MKFADFLKILSKCSQNFREKLRKFSKYGLVGGSGCEAPPKLAKILKN